MTEGPRAAPSPLALAALVALAVAWHAWAAWLGLVASSYDDIGLQWKSCRYVEAGEDPWAIALEVLDREAAKPGYRFGTVWSTPDDPEVRRASPVAARHGVPTPTYGPSTIGILSATIGLAPSREAAHQIWFAVNVAALHALALLLALTCVPPSAGGLLARAAPAYAVLFLLRPAAVCVDSANFSLVALAGALLAARPRTPWWLAGVGLAAALLKPMLGLAFVLFPLLQRRLAPLALAAAIHGVALAWVSARLGRDPVTLHVEWLRVGAHFTAGSYTAQEVLMALGLAGRPAGAAVNLALLGALAAFAVAHRRARLSTLLAFVGAANLVWGYHLAYDFVATAPALLAALVEAPARSRERRSRVAAVALFLACAWAGFDRSVLEMRSPHALALRWPLRIAVIALVAHAAHRLRREAATRPGSPAAEDTFAQGVAT